MSGPDSKKLRRPDQDLPEFVLDGDPGPWATPIAEALEAIGVNPTLLGHGVKLEQDVARLLEAVGRVLITMGDLVVTGRTQAFGSTNKWTY